MANKKNEEKFYTPVEVAQAILKRTHELLKESNLFKSNTSHEVEAGEEPHNDEAEAPEYLANADIENSGAHGEKNKKAKKTGIESADKDGDGDIDGDDAIEAQEEASGEDIDGDGEAGEAPEHKEKIAAAAKPQGEDAPAQDAKATVKAATEEKPDEKKEGKAPPFAKSEAIQNKQKEPSLKKFMLARKMKKAGVPTADSRAAEKMSGATPAPTPAAKIKEQPKLEMEKNKSVEKLMGIAPKAGK
jgi:hypothetical protein